MAEQTPSFSLTSLTPLILSDREKSPLRESRDFLYDAPNHEICVLNPALLKAKLQATGKEDDFERKCRKPHSDYNLRNYLYEQLGLNEYEIDELIQYRRPANGYHANTLDRILPAQQLDGSPQIPASSLGEAIRAACLYDWLKSEKANSGKTLPAKWAAGIGEAYKNCQPFFQELRILQDSYRQRPDRFGEHSKARKDHLEGEIAKQLAEKLGMHESVLFGEGAAEKLNVSSIEAYTEKDLEVQAIGEISIENGDLSNIYLHEAIPAQTKGSFSLQVSDSLDHPYLAKLKESPAEEITAILYDFAYDLLEFEREFIDEVIQENRFGEGGGQPLYASQRQNLELLRNAFDDMMETEMDEADDNTAFLRLRRDGAYMAQTFAMALFNADEEAYDQYQVLSGFLSSHGQVSIFHSGVSLKLGRKRGRRQEAELMAPLGWVKIHAT